MTHSGLQSTAPHSKNQLVGIRISQLGAQLLWDQDENS